MWHTTSAELERRRRTATQRRPARKADTIRKREQRATEEPTKMCSNTPSAQKETRDTNLPRIQPSIGFLGKSPPSSAKPSRVGSCKQNDVTPRPLEATTEVDHVDQGTMWLLPSECFCCAISDPRYKIKLGVGTRRFQ